MSWDTADAVRNMLRRARLVETYDSAGQQTMRVVGLAGEELDKVVRLQPYGFTSHPPAGSEGLIASLGGRSDRAMLLGIEHPKYRPGGLGPGSVAIYDQHENVVSLVESNLRIKHASRIEIAVGDTKIVITAGGVQIDGPSLKHNAKNVGDSHIHGGVIPGGGNTAAPAN